MCELRLTITSRVTLSNARSGYDFAWYIPGTRFENHGDCRTESNIAVGQIVSITTCPLPSGYIHGTVSLYEPNEPTRTRAKSSMPTKKLGSSSGASQCMS
jgi:hypothetical protein